MKDFKSFTKWANNFGQASNAILCVMMLAVAVITSAVFGVWPKMSVLAAPCAAMCTLMIPFAIVEPLAYTGIMGPGGVYMTYITGNTTTVKLPAALGAISIAEVEQGSHEANAVSLVAVGVASLTVCTLIILGIILAIPLTPVLNSPVLAPGFSNIVPALMGALLGMTLFGQGIKYFVVPFIGALICAKLTPISSTYYMIIAIVISVIAGYIMYKRSEQKAA